MSEVPPDVRRVFVYGSLRRGQQYRHLIEPWIIAERPATVRGRLFHFAPGGGRGEYPILTSGDGRVVGEVLEFSDFARVLAVLDELEEHPDVYVREAIEVTYDDGSVARAIAYVIRQPERVAGDEIASGDWLAQEPV